MIYLRRVIIFGFMVITVLSVFTISGVYLYSEILKISTEKDVALSEVVGDDYVIENEHFLKEYNGTKGEFYRYLISVSSAQLIVDKMYAVVLDEEFNVVASQQLTDKKVKTEWAKVQKE